MQQLVLAVMFSGIVAAFSAALGLLSGMTRQWQAGSARSRHRQYLIEAVAPPIAVGTVVPLLIRQALIWGGWSSVALNALGFVAGAAVAYFGTQDRMRRAAGRAIRRGGF